MGIESEKINEKNIHLLFSGVGGIELDLRKQINS